MTARSDIHIHELLRAVCAIGAALAFSAVVLPAAARAGTLAEVFCRTPSGAPAPIEGWEEGWSGTPMPFAGDANECATGGPLSSAVYDNEPQPASTGPIWRYTPEAGYTLTGGEVDASFSVPGGADNLTGAAGLLGPEFNFDSADVIAGPVGGTPATYEGVYSLSGHTGGSLWIYAFCEPPGSTCYAGASFQQYWALAQIHSAVLELTDSSTPQASDFGGSLLAGNASGTATLDFDASEAAPGPGIYLVTVQVDGQTLYQGTPDGNEGRCASIGRNSNGVMEFLHATPCPLSEQVDLPIDTAGLSNGTHELRVSVTDAAGVTETVYDATITTANRTTVSALLDSPPSQALAGESPRYAILASKRTRALTAGVKRSYAHSALTFKGQLQSTAGEPAPGVTITLREQRGNHPGGRRRVLARASTNAAGLWRLRVGKGPSRRLTIGYGQAGDEGIAVKETVRPSLSLHVASPGGGRILFSRHLAITPLGRPRPLVTIQTRTSGGWETVGVPVHVRKDGDYRYVFDSAAVTVGRRFAFRAKTPKASLWSSATSAVHEAEVR